MILEIATLNIKEGHEEAFEQDLAGASHLIAATPGYITHSLHRGQETPNQYKLFVEWETVESHMVDFRESENYTKWAKILTPHYLPERNMFHFTKVYDHR